MVDILSEKENDADKMCQQGIELCDEENYAGAHKFFQKAYSIHPSSAKINSWLGFTTAIVENKVGTGLQMCKKAVDSDIPDAMFFRNIGRLYLLQRNKRAAVGAFARGLQIDKGNRAILKEWKALGFRRKPVIGFLARDNKLNVMLGKLTWKLAKGKNSPK